MCFKIDVKCSFEMNRLENVSKQNDDDENDRGNCTKMQNKVLGTY